MADLGNDQVEVFHKGDKKKGIEGTGKKRLMGTLQFQDWGKNNGWAKVPATSKGAKVETADDSTNTSTGTGNTDDNKPKVILSKDDQAVDAIVKIKKLGKAKKLDEIKVYIDGDKRSTIIAAANKFLNA